MLYDLTNKQFIHMLKNVSGIFDKAQLHAETKKYDVNVLAGSRLAPDQFDLVRQVQILCDTAKMGAALLTGQEPPKQDDNEKTFPELRARVDSVIQYLSKFSPKDYEGAAERRINRPRWESKWLNGAEFAQHHVIPNFYFHMTTMYAILRHNGVDVGKGDYLGKMPFRT
jgi:hypothetical protein